MKLLYDTFPESESLVHVKETLMDNFPLLTKPFEIPLPKRKEKEILDLIATLLNKLPRLWSKVGIFEP